MSMSPKQFGEHIANRGKPGWRARRKLTEAERQRLRDHINRKFDDADDHDDRPTMNLWEVGDE